MAGELTTQIPARWRERGWSTDVTMCLRWRRATAVAIHMVSLATEAGEVSDAIRLADDVNISAVPSLERRTTHLYQVARAYEQRNNDTAVLTYLRMAHRECPQDFQYKPHLRGLVSTLVRRARPSYAAEVREFASTIGLLGE